MIGARSGTHASDTKKSQINNRAMLGIHQSGVEDHMGICFHVVESKFFLAETDKAKAFEAAKPLHGHWVREGDTKHCEDLAEVLEIWGYEVEEDSKGNIVKIFLCNEKLGDEIKMFKAIAPYVKAGSYLECGGDCGSWRWVFNGTTCEEKSPRW